MAKKRARYSTRKLTEHLRELAAEAESINDEGGVITKGEALARMLWAKALGYEETDPKTGVIEAHKPAAWAIQLLWDRMEGRTPQAITYYQRILELGPGHKGAILAEDG